MKILFLTPRFPYPLDQGTNLRNYRLIQSAALQHEVHLLSFLDRPLSMADLETVQAVCTRVELRPAPARPPLRRLVQTIAAPLPDMAYRRWSTQYATTLHRMLGEERYQIVQAEGIEMAGYLPLCRGVKTVFSEHNVEHQLQERAYRVDLASARRLPNAYYSGIQSRKLRRFERYACLRAHRVLVVSREDGSAIESLAPGSTPAIVPNAIDVAAYPPRQREPERPAVLFTGTFDYRPNIDAVRWLLDEIFPLVRRRHPETRAFVVGRGPRPWMVARGQHDPKIAVTGEVDSLDPYWQRATLYLLPMRGGGGTRFKALEAMAAGLPIVSTPMGMEGIEARPDLHYLAGDTAAELAVAAARLIDDAELRATLAANSRVLVQRYDWRAVALSLLSVYRELVCVA